MVMRVVTWSHVSLALLPATGAMGLCATVLNLANATGLHRNRITNIEVGGYTGTQDSFALIESAFREAGVEFVPQSGGRFHDRPDTSYEGQ
jgi:hypothetical protein